jgi:hypothetical protein
MSASSENPDLIKSLQFMFEFCLHELLSLLERASVWLLAQAWVQGVILQVLWLYSRASVEVEKWLGKTTATVQPFVSTCILELDSLDFSEVKTLLPPGNDPVVSLPAIVQNMARAPAGAGTRREPVLHDCVVLWQVDADHVVVRKTVPLPREIPLGSKTRFLAVTYHHPDLLDETVSLEIPLAMMLVDNELLSSAFVRRFLNSTTPFDQRYWLECIDSDLTCFTVKSTEYVRLSTDKGWRLM